MGKFVLGFLLGAFALLTSSVSATADPSAFCKAYADTLIPTRTAPDRLTQVQVGIWPLEAGEIDDKTQTFFADFYLALEWVDPRLAFEAQRFAGELGEDIWECDLPPKLLTEDSLIWNPSLEFLALRGDPSVRGPRLLVEADGTVYYEARLAGNFKASFDFRNFPFDRQTLTLEVQPYDTADRVVLVPYETYFEGLDADTLKAGAREVDFLDWSLIGVTATAQDVDWGNEVYSSFRYSLDLARKPFQFVLNFFIPVFMLVILAGAVFWLAPRETETRVNLSVTSLLTLVAFNLILRDQLPDLPYATLADQVNSLSLLYAILAVMVVVAVHVLKTAGHEEQLERRVPYLRFGFPLSYALLVAGVMTVSLIG